MKTRIEVIKFLDSLLHRRFTYKQMDKAMGDFFGMEMKGEETTEAEFDLDYTRYYTTGNELSTSSFVDVQVYYLETREKIDGEKVVYVTETAILDYQP